MGIIQFRSSDSLFLTWVRSLIDDLPLMLQIYRYDGLMVATNRVSEQFWSAPREIVVEQFNLLEDPQNIALGIPEIFQRVYAGEIVQLPPVLFRKGQRRGDVSEGVDVWVEVVYFPVRGEDGMVSYVGLLHRDVTVQVQQGQDREKVERELAHQSDMLAADQDEIVQQQEQITRQRETILSLSSLIVPVWERVLLVPLVGVIDEMRATHITERLLEAIICRQSSVVVFDVDELRPLDRDVASYVLHAIRSCRLVGNQVVVTGATGEVMRMVEQASFDDVGVMSEVSLAEGIRRALGCVGVVISDRTASECGRE